MAAEASHAPSGREQESFAAAPRVAIGAGSIERAAANARSSTLFAARLDAFKQANAIYLKACHAPNPVDDMMYALCDVAGDAYLDLVVTPAPDMYAFADKVAAVAEWHNGDGPLPATVDAICADVRALFGKEG